MEHDLGRLQVLREEPEPPLRWVTSGHGQMSPRRYFCVDANPPDSPVPCGNAPLRPPRADASSASPTPAGKASSVRGSASRFAPWVDHSAGKVRVAEGALPSRSSDTAPSWDSMPPRGRPHRASSHGARGRE